MEGQQEKADDLFAKIRVKAVRDPYCAYQMALFDQNNEAYERAEKLYRRASELEDGFWEAEYNLGNLYRDTKRYDLAMDAYKRALKGNQNNSDILFNAGITAEGSMHFSEAVDFYLKALPLDQEKAELYCRLGCAYTLDGQPEEAESCWSIIEESYPDTAIYFVTRAALAFRKVQEEKGFAYLMEAMDKHIVHPSVYAMLADYYSRKDDFEKSHEYLQLGLEEFPDSIPLWETVLKYHIHQANYRQALQIGEELNALGLDSFWMQYNLALAHFFAGDAEASKNLWQELLKERPNQPELITGFLGILAYSSDYSPEEIYNEHLRLGEVLSWGKEPLDIVPPGKRNRDKLRIGFISGDFRNHAAARHVFPWFHNRDRERFEYYAYAQCQTKDYVSNMFEKLSDKWQEVTSLNDIEVAKLIAGDEIDILVDLSGHTAHNRLGVFPYRPAPVQISTIGANVTTGLPSVDYFFSYNDVVAETQKKYFIEEVESVPIHHSEVVSGGALFSKQEFVVPPEPPQVENGFVTYACYSRVEKIEPQLIEVMIELLKRTDNTVLRLMNMSFRDKIILDKNVEYFMSQGIERERLKFYPAVPLAHYMGSMQTVDFALLSYPFTGGTVAADFVTMGVPFVTRYSDLPQSRDGYGVLKIYDLEEQLAVPDYDRYLEAALKYGQDVDFLRKFRALINSLPRDSDMFTPAIAKAFEKIWVEKGGNLSG
ncbi:O-linked N-acetylglucosamine transferase, SPINDLY family protein [Kiloniella sp. b19]|uniref:O-linked N-acetylglucosamine transferase, SPINDLY family protein n=1 Tax=Kiloniella sp. GXU_MW_B19 TaxID=3141326 RepID=UPI0031CFF24D